MKTRNVIAATVLVLATSFAGVSSANVSTGSIGTDVQSAAGIGNVTVTVDNGVATLFGQVETLSDAYAVEAAALEYPDVDSVTNYVWVNN